MGRPVIPASRPTVWSGLLDDQRLWALAVVLADVWLMMSAGFGGWPLHDCGQFGQSAERVLQGELPHRDFDETYTGGLALWHAGAFLLFGVRLASMRYALVIASVPFAWALFDIARRFCRPFLAFLLTTSALFASLGSWPTDMPNWYLLFLSTAGIWALCRYVETQRWYWVVLAGAIAAQAILVKITGVYFVASAGLFLTLLGGKEKSQCREWRISRRSLWDVSVGLLALLSVGALLSRHFDLDTIGFVGLPAMAMAVALPVVSWSPPAALLLRRYAWFSVGAAAPLLLFLVPYLASGSLSQLWNGLFYLPTIRLSAAAYPAPPIVFATAALPLSYLTLARRGRHGLWLTAASLLMLAVVLSVALAADYGSQLRTPAMRIAMGTWAWLLPVIAVPAVWLLRRETGACEKQIAYANLVLVTAAFFALNQYPFMHPLYTLFCTPLVFLAAAGIASLGRTPPGSGLIAGLLCVGLFCGLRFSGGGICRDFFSPRSALAFQTLDLPRGGLTVLERDRIVYEELNRLIERQIHPGDTVLAGPDCPEIYFLYGLRNPTRTLWDIFDTTSDRSERLLAHFEDRTIAMAIVNRAPEFSPPWEPSLLERFAERSERIERIGPFLVFFKRSQGISQDLPNE